jgi:hypothetical protein
LQSCSGQASVCTTEIWLIIVLILLFVIIIQLCDHKSNELKHELRYNHLSKAAAWNQRFVIIVIELCDHKSNQPKADMGQENFTPGGLLSYRITYRSQLTFGDNLASLAPLPLPQRLLGLVVIAQGHDDGRVRALASQAQHELTSRHANLLK